MEESEVLLGKYESMQSPTKPNLLWIIAFVSTASQAMICTGLFTAIAGPTLQFLALNTKSTVDEVSSMFVGRSMGTLSGAVAFSFIGSKYNKERPFIGLGIGSCALGLATFCTPFAHSVITLICLHAIGGFSVGYVTTALSSLYLAKWGEVDSRPYIQLQFFMYAIGAFLAPIIAKPFLEISSRLGNPSATCPGQTMKAMDKLVSRNFTNSSTDSVDSQAVWSSYSIFGGYVIFVAMLFCILTALGAEHKIADANIEIHSAELQQEDSKKRLWLFLISVMMFNFCAIPCYVVYQEYIYACAACSNLRMNAANASLLTSFFWGGFVLGRTLGVLISKYIKPAIMIITDAIGTTSIMVVISVWGEKSTTVIWIGTFVYGVFVATIQPSCISWSSQVINMTGKYQFVFLAGGNVGNSVLLRVAGMLFQNNPFSVIYLVTWLCGTGILCFGLMNIFAWNSRLTS